MGSGDLFYQEDRMRYERKQYYETLKAIREMVRQAGVSSNPETYIKVTLDILRLVDKTLDDNPHGDKYYE